MLRFFSCFGVFIRPTTELCCFYLALLLIGFSHTEQADGAKAFYVFGDSFTDTGNGKLGKPYGMTWPGHSTGRFSDGRNQVDYFADLFGLPSPVPYLQLKNNNQSTLGVNFGQGGAGVTYAWGYTPLDTQVDQLETLVKKGVLCKAHLMDSVALVSLGVNDYGASNTYHTLYKESSYAQELKTTVTTVVDGIALNIMRLHGLGIRSIIISNLASMACSPYITVAANYSHCSSNTTLLNETLTHNALLEQRVKLLKQELPRANIVIVDQTKAFEHLFRHGSEFGFVDTLKPCCTGKDDPYVLNCGYVDSKGKPLYRLCQNAEKAVIFDGIHPTQAAWRVVVHLYASVTGFTQQGPKLQRWIQENNV